MALKDNADGTPMQWGLKSTFLSLPHVDIADPDFAEAKPDYAILGMPFEGCCVYRTGTSFAPQTMRRVTEMFSTYNIEMDTDITEDTVVIDAGDVPIVPGSPNENLANLEEAAEKIAAAGAVPLVIGGDHSISYPIFKGIARGAGYKKLGLIHFDTHMDFADTYGGNKTSNCTQIRRMSETVILEPKNIVQVGIRGHLNPKSMYEKGKEIGINTILINEILDDGIEAVMKKAIEMASDGTEGIYVTFDIDVIDPAYCPGTSAPTPGGLTMREAIKAIRMVGEHNVVGFDLACVSPAVDIADITSRAGVTLFIELLSSMVKAKHS